MGNCGIKDIEDFRDAFASLGNNWMPLDVPDCCGSEG